MMPVCASCGASFEVQADKAARFPGWTPRECPKCWKAGKAGGAAARPAGGARTPGGRGRRSALVEDNLTTAEVLARHTGGPTDGVFTDGSATPNPGPGGWGAVYVVADEVIARDHGTQPHTTNNKMELQAIAAGIALVPEGTPVTVYSDSKLAVDTLTTWAHSWARAGWKRKGGAIKNLELIKPLFAIVNSRPEITIRWIAAHSGNRWNEYADSLSTAYLREEV